MILRASFFIVASVAALTVSRISIKSSRKAKNQIGTAEDDASIHKENEKEEKKEKMSEDDDVSDKKMQEERRYYALKKEMENRKVELERRLHELYGLREEYSLAAYLREQLKQKSLELDKLNVALCSLWCEKEKLEEEIRQGHMVEKQLELANKMVEELQDRVDSNASQMKEQLRTLEDQVLMFQNKGRENIDAVIAKKLSALYDFKLEILEMKRKNKELELEKRELTFKLGSAQAKATSLAEGEIIARVNKEIAALRYESGDLLKQVDKLQKDRFNTVEELVYQRWLNYCLRHEIQSYKSPKILNHDLRKKSILKTPYRNVATSESSSSSQDSTYQKLRFVQKIKKKWRRSESDIPRVESVESSRKHSLIKTGLLRRFSTSISLPSRSTSRNKVEDVDISKRGEDGKQEYVDFPETPSSRRQKKVSFDDYVYIRNIEAEFEDTTESEESEPTETEELYADGDIKVAHADSDDSSSNVLVNQQKEGPTLCSPVERTLDENVLEQVKGNEQLVPLNEDSQKTDENHSTCHVAVFCIFIFILTVYFLLQCFRIFQS